MGLCENGGFVENNIMPTTYISCNARSNEFRLHSLPLNLHNVATMHPPGRSS